MEPDGCGDVLVKIFVWGILGGLVAIGLISLFGL